MKWGNTEAGKRHNDFVFRESLGRLYGEYWRETKKEAKRPVRKLEIIQVSDEGGLN